MTWTVGKKISGGFLAVIALVALMSGFTYYEVGQLNAMHLRAAMLNLEKTQLAQGVATDIANEAVAMRRFNFTGDANDIQVFHTYRTQAEEKLQRLDAILASEGNKQLLLRIRQEKSAYEGIADRSFAAKRAGDQAAVGRYMAEAGAPYKASMGASLELVGNVKEYVKNDEAAAEAQAAGTQRLLLVVNLLVALVAFALSQYLSRSISRPARRVSAAAAAIADGDLGGGDL